MMTVLLEYIDRSIFIKYTTYIAMSEYINILIFQPNTTYSAGIMLDAFSYPLCLKFYAGIIIRAEHVSYLYNCVSEF